MTVDARAAKDDVLARLRAVIKTYDGEIPQDDPPPVDGDGRVRPYTVLYVNPGSAYATTVCDTPRDMAWGFQVTCVGGDPDRCLWAVTKARTALTGARLTVDGARSGLLAETLDRVFVRRDDEPTPSRHYAPIQYGVDLTG
ncbi:MAG: hypothetical protein J2P24_00370 [Streptosporangiales bacterium]|nr:hypothetical protein [Streptosporangiales bacterium]